jgi:hypothetical protein
MRFTGRIFDQGYGGFSTGIYTSRYVESRLGFLSEPRSRPTR